MENTATKRHENLKLPNGESVSLTFFPERGWTIREYEFSILRPNPTGGLPILNRYHGAPRHWKELAFESPDKAAAYVESEISAGRAQGIPKGEDKT